MMAFHTIRFWRYVYINRSHAPEIRGGRNTKFSSASNHYHVTIIQHSLKFSFILFRVQLCVELSTENKKTSKVQQDESYVAVGIKRKNNRKRRGHKPVDDGSCRIHKTRVKAADLGLKKPRSYFKHGVIVSYCAGTCSVTSDSTRGKSLFTGIHKKPCCVATEFYRSAIVLHGGDNDQEVNFEANAKRCECR